MLWLAEAACAVSLHPQPHCTALSDLQVSAALVHQPEESISNSLAAVDGQFVNAGLQSSCKVCPMGSQQQMRIVHGVLAQHHSLGDVKPYRQLS